MYHPCKVFRLVSLRRFCRSKKFLKAFRNCTKKEVGWVATKFRLTPMNTPNNIINHPYIFSLAWSESGKWMEPDLLRLKYTWPASAAGWLNRSSNILRLYHPSKALRLVGLGRFCRAKVSAPPFIADTFAHLSPNNNSCLHGASPVKCKDQ